MKTVTDDTCVILLSEDDPDEQYLFKSAFSDCGFPVEFFTVQTGKELIEFLIRHSIFSNAVKIVPDLIVADLRLPFFDLDTIREIRVYSQFRKIPVYVFSMSADTLVMNQVITSGANGFYRKPGTYHELKKIARDIVDKIKIKSA